MNDVQLKDGILLLNDYASSLEFITDETEKVVPFRRKSMVGCGSLINLLSEGSLGFTYPDILPKNCRHFSFTPRNNNIRIVIEQSPATRSIRVNLDLSYSLERLKAEGKLEAYGYKDYKLDSKPHILRLAFPYIVLIIDLSYELKYKNCRVFYRTAPLTSIQDFLLKSNMLNTDHTGIMCIRGTESESQVESVGSLLEKVTLPQRIDQILNRVWLNTFNTDFHGSHILYKDVPQVGNLLEWQYFSKVDPMFVFKVPWFQHVKNLYDEIGLDEIKNNPIQNEEVILKIQGIISGKWSKDFFIARSTAESIFIQDGNFELDDGEDEDFHQEEDDSTQSFTISVGDELVLDKKVYYITAFKSTKSNSVDIIEMEDEEKHISNQKLTDRLKKKIINFLKKKPVNSIVTKNGKTIKRGDLVEFKLPGYEKIISADEVRVSRDGLSEIKCGKTVYLVDFVDFNIIDKDNLEFNGIKFRKGEKFLIKTPGRFSGKVFVGVMTTFEEFKEGKLFFTKNETKKERLKIDVFEEISSLVKKIEEDLTPIPIARIGNKIIVSDKQQKIFITKDRSIIISGEVVYLNSEVPNWKEHAQNMFLEDGKRFLLPSYDVDIDLRVGDDIIATTWENPLDLLKIRKITGFIFDPTKSTKIEVTTTIESDKSTERTFPLVDFNYSFGSASVGCIRKASYSVDGLTIGMEVIPRQRVPGFSKSKPCRISAFIVDHEIPIVLCSNYHTFWLTENNKRLFTFRPSPLASNVEFTIKTTAQYGDIFSNQSYDYDAYRLTYYTGAGGRNTWKRVSMCSDVRWTKYRSGGLRTPDPLPYGLIPQRMKNIPRDAMPDMFGGYTNLEISKDIM